MVKEYFYGLMEENIKEILLMIKKMVMVCCNGLMEEFMKDIFKKVCKMVKESIRIKMGNGFREAGIKANTLNDLLKYFRFLQYINLIIKYYQNQG